MTPLTAMTGAAVSTQRSGDAASEVMDPGAVT